LSKTLAPESKKDTLELSYQYQREWRCEKDRELMEHAKTLFPDWEYVEKRLEWHARPEFHRDPDKSKVQPRQPIYLPRDENHIPKQETLDGLCFVTGASSNHPYFELAVQLIESIKATRWYKNVPINILDCGLTEEDAQYLRDRFECNIKDPGWDIDLNSIKKSAWHENPNAFKNMTAVHCLHKHFPDHEYYIWLDCDQWIQSELILDQQISLCEKQLIAGSYIRIPDRHLQICWKNVLSSSYLKTLIGKPCITGGFWIAHREFLKLYNHEMNTHIQQTEHYTYGSNDSISM